MTRISTRFFERFLRPDVLVGALCVGVAAALLVTIAVVKHNVPVLDDYAAVLGFFAALHEASGAGDVMSVVLEPHNRHRIVTTRLAAWFDLALFGSVDFRRLSIFAALGLAPITLTLIAIFKRDWSRGREGLLAALAMTLLLWRPEDWKHLLYAMANIQAIWATAFSVLFLFLLTADRHALRWAAFPCFAAALLTNTSALLLVPLGLAAAFLQGRLMLGTVFAVFAALAVFLFFQDNPGGEGVVKAFLDHPWICLRFALGVFGSGFEAPAPEGRYAPVFGGAALAFGVWMIVRTGRLQDRLATKLVLLYLLGVCFLIAGGRALLYEDRWEQLVLDGRYRIYSLVALALITPLAARAAAERLRLQGRIFAARAAPAGALIFALGVNLMSYADNLGEWRKRTAHTNGKVVHYLRTGDASRLPPNRDAERLLKSALAHGDYKPDPPRP